MRNYYLVVLHVWKIRLTHAKPVVCACVIILFYSRYNASGNSMFMVMTLPDLFPTFSKRFRAWYSVVFEKEIIRSLEILRSVKVFQDEPRLTVILLGRFPGQLSSFPSSHSGLPPLSGRPSRILINRSTARFFVTVAWKNGISSHIRRKIL